MSVFSSFRSNSYQLLQKLLTESNHFEAELYALIKDGLELTKIKAKWAKPIVKKVGQFLSRILRNRLDDKLIVETLKEVARKLNRVYYRSFQYSAAVADAAKKLYEKVIDMLPKNTSVQLELLGGGDYSCKETKKPILGVVQKFLNHLGESKAPKKNKVEPKGEQLELNLGVVGD